MYACHACSSGCHCIQRSKIWRALTTFPMISSMYVYFCQKVLTRGMIVTARSQMLRAWFTCFCLKSTRGAHTLVCQALHRVWAALYTPLVALIATWDEVLRIKRVQSEPWSPMHG
jgi:hypothetical protein